MNLPSRHALAGLAMILALAGSAPTIAAPLRVYAAGDIAECRGDPASDSAAARVAALIPDGATVLVLGDTAYPQGDTETLTSCYGPTWGRFREHTFAVPGNHDYVRNGARDFSEYFFGTRERDTWFRVALGDWWVIGLDSNLRGPALQRQQAWLEHELTTIRNDGHCVIAMWHHALYSTGLHKGDGEPMRAAWRALDEAGADIVLTGHEHFYESFDPLDAGGRPKAVGIREFVVGTGGARLADLSLSSRHRAYAHEYGVLELDLEPQRFSYVFHSVSGTAIDRGGASCRRPRDRATHAEVAISR